MNKKKKRVIIKFKTKPLYYEFNPDVLLDDYARRLTGRKDIKTSPKYKKKKSK